MVDDTKGHPSDHILLHEVLSVEESLEVARGVPRTSLGIDVVVGGLVFVSLGDGEVVARPASCLGVLGEVDIQVLDEGSRLEAVGSHFTPLVGLIVVCEVEVGRVVGVRGESGDGLILDVDAGGDRAQLGRGVPGSVDGLQREGGGADGVLGAQHVDIHLPAQNVLVQRANCVRANARAIQ